MENTTRSRLNVRRARRSQFAVALTAALVTVLVSVAAPPPARAERSGTTEIGASGGFRLSGRLRGRTDSAGTEYDTDVYFAYGPSFGAYVSHYVQRDVELSVSWMHQDTEIDNGNVDNDDPTIPVDASIDDFLVGLFKHGGRAYDRIRPFGGFEVGGTLYDFEGEQKGRFAMSLAGGGKMRLSERARFRVQGRWRWSYLGRNSEFFCDRTGECWRFDRSNWHAVWEVGGSVGFVF